MKDIEALNTRHILFIDDNFIGEPAYTADLLNAMRSINSAWSAAVTTDILEHPDLLDLMAETGCKSLFIGFESLNTKSLESVSKGNNAARYEDLVEAIHSRGIMINASMVFGLDGDDGTVFDQTLNWLVNMRIETLTSHILTPYPGTALYKSMQAAGRITDYDLAKYNTAHVVYKPANMTAAELHSGYLQMYKQFYSFKNIIRRIPRSKTQRLPYFLFNLCYRKFGGFTSLVARLIPLGLLGRFAAGVSYLRKNLSGDIPTNMLKSQQINL